MAKAYFYYDEWNLPIFTIHNDYAAGYVEVDDDTLAAYLKTYRAYHDMNRDIEEMLNND